MSVGGGHRGTIILFDVKIFFSFCNENYIVKHQQVYAAMGKWLVSLSHYLYSSVFNPHFGFYQTKLILVNTYWVWLMRDIIAYLLTTQNVYF